jgi:hypothetical protein
MKLIARVCQDLEFKIVIIALKHCGTKDALPTFTVAD